jgi:hypothetical protein
MTKTVFVKAGEWRTLESVWNARLVAVFLEPAGAHIKIRYGDGSFLGVDSDNQTLDGRNRKTLRVGRGSFFYARIQIRVTFDASITYDVFPGEVPS